LTAARPPAPGWLNDRRLLAWSAVFLAVESALTVLLVLQQNNVILPVGPSSIDFVSFYAAGKLVLAGTPWLAYDQAAHHAAEQQATMAGAPYVFFFYPPMFLLLCAALARLPYLLAFALFQGATFALFAVMLRRVLRAQGWAWLLPVIAFPATFWNVGQGQNGFLTATLLGGFALVLERRPAAAGAMVGALCFKPHLALLTPVALAAGLHWRAFAAAALTACAITALSLALLGPATFRAYFAAMAGAEPVYASGRINFAGFVSLFGGLRLTGVAPWAAYAVQAAAAIAAAAAVALAWRRGAAPVPAPAALLAATLLAVPLVLLYDQLFAVVAAAWLMRAGGLDRCERLVIVLCYPLALVAPALALGPKLPAGLAVSCALAGLCLRRAWRER
jgi:hypothetical protein